MNNCVGCGALLQNTDKNQIGYCSNNSNLCERCFRIRNYGEYKLVVKDNDDFVNILKEIDKTGDLVVLVIDVFNLIQDLSIIKDNISNDILLVLTKRDILPKSLSDEKIISYFERFSLNIVSNLVISSNKNYHFDELYDKINFYKKSNDVYVIGFTNAGKSSMINKFIHNYSDSDMLVTTSILPSTTLNKINIKVNDNLTLIDTPGLIVSNSYFNLLDGRQLKRIFPKKEIKPISYQIKESQYIVIDRYAYIEASNIILVIFMSNDLNIKRFYKPQETNLKLNKILVSNNDVVINGLGFIKCIGYGVINVYTYDDVCVYTRDSLI